MTIGIYTTPAIVLLVRIMTVKELTVIYALGVAALMYVGLDEAALTLAEFMSASPSAEQIALTKIGIGFAMAIGLLTLVVGYVIECKDGKGRFRLD